MSMLPSLSFAALLKRYRLAAGLTQEDLAERAHLSVKAIGALEQGTRRLPRQDTLDLLADALQLAPGERAQLQAAARGGPLGAPSPPRALGLLPGASRLPLVGRVAERHLIKQHLAGEGSLLLLVAGEPGIGKTRLLQEAGERAASLGWTILTGGCHRRSGQEPYAPLLGALSGHLRSQSPAIHRSALQGCAWLVRLLPELAESGVVPAPSWSLPPEQERRLMFAAVARFLANVAGPAGTLLVLDDLQWAGADALDLLGYLVRSAGELPLRVLGAYRSTEVRPPDPLGVTLADLTVAGLARQHVLRPLAPTEAAALLQHILDGGEQVDSTLRAQVVARTGGVPYFLVSCAQALRSGVLEGQGSPSVPWNVAESIRQRVVSLPEPAQELLGIAAVAGREGAEAVLLSVAAQPKAEVLSALETLDRARLLVEGAQASYQFPHDLIREAVLGDMSAVRQHHWHGQIAAALEQTPGELPIEQVAYHYSQAGELEKAVVYLERAGDRAWARHANAEAEGYYRDLLAHLERLGRIQAMIRIRERLAQVLTMTGQWEETLVLLTQAEGAYRAADDHEGRWRVLAALGNIYADSLRANEGLALLQPVLEGARPDASPRALAALQSALALLYYNAGQEHECLALAERTVDLARTAGDERLLLEAQFNYAGTLEFLGRFEEALPLFEEALLQAEQAGDLYHLGKCLQARAGISMNRNALEQGFAFYSRSLEITEQLGDPYNRAFVLVMRADCLLWLGEWHAAHQDLVQAQAVLRQMRPSDPLTSCDVLISLGRLSLAQGQWEEGERLLKEALALAEPGGHFLRRQRLVQTTLAEQDLLAGRPQVAQARLKHLLAQPGLPQLDREWVVPLLAWARLDVGAAAQAEELLAQAGEQAQRDHRLRGEVRRIQAQRCIQQQRWEEAQVALEEAVGLARSLATPYPEAKALYRAGLLHQAKDEPDQARKQLVAALAILNRLGERPYAEQVERALAEVK